MINIVDALSEIMSSTPSYPGRRRFSEVVDAPILGIDVLIHVVDVNFYIVYTLTVVVDAQSSASMR